MYWIYRLMLYNIQIFVLFPLVVQIFVVYLQYKK
nr:MAG TPA: hypothetical protein [Caudoviricetes sp.]